MSIFDILGRASMTFAELPDFESLIISPKNGGDDLPGHTEFVLEPAARLPLTAFREVLPQPVDFFLRVAVHEEGSPLREREVRAAVHGHESRSVEFERRVQHLPRRDRTSLLPADQADDP